MSERDVVSAPTLSQEGRGRQGAKRLPGEGLARTTPLNPSTAHARALRQRQTDAERLLWSRLRARRLAGCKFRRQVPVDRFIVDFACIDAKVAIELDGGGHSFEQAVSRDLARTRVIEAAGFLVVRFWNREVIENLDGVCDTILSVLEGR